MNDVVHTRIRPHASAQEDISVGQLWDACLDLGSHDVKAGMVFESVMQLLSGWKDHEKLT